MKRYDSDSFFVIYVGALNAPLLINDSYWFFFLPPIVSSVELAFLLWNQHPQRQKLLILREQVAWHLILKKKSIIIIIIFIISLLLILSPFSLFFILILGFLFKVCIHAALWTDTSNFSSRSVASEHSEFPLISDTFHRITGFFMLEDTSKIIRSNHYTSITVFTIKPRSQVPHPEVFLSTSRYGDSTISLGSFFQCMTMFSVKRFS